MSDDVSGLGDSASAPASTTTRQRILILQEHAGIGGVETSLANLLNYLDLRDCDVDIVFQWDEGPLMDRVPPRFRIVDVHKGLAGRVYRSSGFRQAVRSPGLRVKATRVFWASIRKALEMLPNPYLLLNRIDEHYDIAIAYRQGGFAPFYLVDRVDADRKYMWFHHGVYTPGKKGEETDRRYSESLDGVIAVSDSCRASYLSHFPTQRRKVRVIHSIIDCDEILSLSMQEWDQLASTPVTLVSVTRLSSEKGLDLTLATAARLRDLGLDYVWYVIGEGPARVLLEEGIRDQGLEASLILLGERANPYPGMAAADIFVHVSQVEAYGLVVAEAMVLQKPIVAADIPAMRELLADGRLGVLAEPECDAFATAISELAGSSEKRREFGQRLAEQGLDNTRAFKGLSDLLAGPGDFIDS